MEHIDLQADLRVRILVSAQRMRRNLACRAHAYGMTLTDLAALHVLLPVEDEGVSPADMSRLLGISRPLSSRIVGRLERAGLIEVIGNPSVPRFKRIRLSAEGFAAYCTASSHHHGSGDESELTRDEALALYPLLERIEQPMRPTTVRSRREHVR